MMGIVVFCFLCGFYAGYRWGHWDGRIEETGRQMDNHVAIDRREMDMDRLYSQKVRELTSELHYWKQVAKEVKS